MADFDDNREGRGRFRRRREVSVGTAVRPEMGTSADARAFTELLAEYDDRMRAVAYGMVGSAAAMDDVLQDAYLKAWRARDRFRGDAMFSTWLHRIVVNSCLDHLRRARRVQPITGVDLEEEVERREPTGDAFDLRIVDTELVGWALSELGDDQRLAVLLVDGDGMSYPEAAAVLGVAEGTIGSRVSRARSELRRLLRSQGVER